MYFFQSFQSIFFLNFIDLQLRWSESWINYFIEIYAELIIQLIILFLFLFIIVSLLIIVDFFIENSTVDSQQLISQRFSYPIFFIFI